MFISLRSFGLGLCSLCLPLSVLCLSSIPQFVSSDWTQKPETAEEKITNPQNESCYLDAPSNGPHLPTGATLKKTLKLTATTVNEKKPKEAVAV